MAYLIVPVVLALAVLVISAPLRSGRRARDPRAEQIAELEAARDAKYREIRDAELDMQTGKLSPEDYEAIDRGLRADAIEIMHALDAATPDD
jgi:hypothetical protein